MQCDMDPYKEDKSKFIGIWEITECSLNEKLEIIGLEGIKFRLDEMGDITWFNDLVYTIPSNDNLTDIDNILFCCETYEIYDDGPGIAFGAFAGYSIEFKTDTLKPDKIMNLYCTGWYTLKCRRLEEDQSIRQQAPFTLLSAFELGFFCDDSVTSSDDVQYFLHSPILRMNGFDCSMNYQTEKSSNIITEKNLSKVNKPLITINNINNNHNNNNNNTMTEANQIKISIIAPSTTINTTTENSLSSSFPSTSTSKLTSPFSSKTLFNSSSSSLNVSSDNHQHHHHHHQHHHQNHHQHKIISSLLSPSRELFHLSSKIASNLSNSFHCLSSTRKSQEFVDQIIHNNYCSSNNKLNINSNETNNTANKSNQNSSSLMSLNNIKLPTTSSSDSDLLQMTNHNNNHNNNNMNGQNNNNSNQTNTKLITSPTSTTTTTTKNIFNFNEFLLDSNRLIKCRPPLSPYRSKSPSFSSSTDTPPTSPLTPISVLQSLSAEMLEPIIQWLYSESLPEKLPENICEKLITFAESTIPLNKMAEPCRQYSRAIKLKKFVIRIIMDIHNCLNRIINLINPEKLSRLPVNLCLIFKEVLREFAVGCAKILQFCNIFSRTSTRKTREQRNELIKYARSRLPDFTAQIHQLLTNIFKVLSNLNEEEKTELVVYLVPEIKSSLSLLTSIINQIKASLETMCKHIKRSNSFKKHSTTKLTTSPSSSISTGTTATSPTITNNRRLRQLDIISNNNNNNTDTNNVVSINKMDDYDHICFYNCGCTNNTNNNNNCSSNINSDSNSRGSGTAWNCPNSNSISSDLHSTDGQDISLTESHHRSPNNLNSVLYIYELKKMKDIYERVTSALDVIQQKRTAYNEMNTQNKQETIRNNLEHFLTLIPVYIEMIEELSSTAGELLEWTEFKCFFKLFTSQINGVISKLVAHRLALNDAITFICSVVKNTEFTLSLINLGLLKPNKHLQNQCETELDIHYDEEQYDFDSPKINLTQHLCEPPIAAQSSLSKNALRLFHVENLTDMEFEIISFPSDRTKLLTPDYETKYERYGNECNIHLYKAHRVIVAARSEWFRKALLCGMKESINRKFIIHDSSPVIFRRFLLYIYGAPIDNTVGVEQICELMSLADRYNVDELKDICENTLKSLIDDTSVIYLLEMADRYNTIKLKNECIFYISRNLHIINFDTYYDLSNSLKLEIQEVIQWYGRLPTEPWTDNDKKRHTSLKSPSRSRRSSPSYRKS